MASKCQNPTRAYSQLETEWVGVGVALHRLPDPAPKVSTKDRAMLPFRACVSACFRASSYSSYSLQLATKVQRNKETYRGASEEKKKKKRTLAISFRLFSGSNPMTGRTRIFYKRKINF